MAAVNPSLVSSNTPLPVIRLTVVGSTPLSDADTMTFSEFPNEIRGFSLLRVDNGVAVVATKAGSVITIGVNAPPLANIDVVGIVMGR